ncbi:hypothetical protein O0544_18430 [Edwardsiella anguillarum]|nr:hypothetical protein [Edwardsiella anguillarum]
MKTPISLLLLTGMGLTPVSWADLTPKSHIGIAGVDFQSQLAIDQGYMGNVTYLPAVAPASNAAFGGCGHGSRRSPNAGRTAISSSTAATIAATARRARTTTAITISACSPAGAMAPCRGSR